MKVKELKELLNDPENGIKDEDEVKVRTSDGEGGVWRASADDGVFALLADGGEKTGVYRIEYVITKDHRVVAVDSDRVRAASDMDVVLDLDKYREKYLKAAGVEGEVSEKTGSTVVEEEEDAVVAKDGKAVVETKKVKHYYNCEIVEVMKEVDEERDLYVRVWKRGTVA